MILSSSLSKSSYSSSGEQSNLDTSSWFISGSCVFEGVVRQILNIFSLSLSLPLYLCLHPSLSFTHTHTHTRTLDTPSNQPRYLDDNDITTSSLNTSSFTGQGALQTLSLSNCKLGPVLGSKRFSELQSLINLDISKNNIVSINYDAFQDLTNLQVLKLSLNRIVDLDHDAFHDLTNLRELDLSNNLVRTVSLVWFLGVPTLETLSLDGNQIDKISIFSTSSSTQEQQNSQRERRRLNNVFSLNSLNLRNNFITTIEPLITTLLCNFHENFQLIMDGIFLFIFFMKT